MQTCDIAIIGAGAAGLTAAITARGFGKKVVLIEKARPGGECTWSGCVPSKALIHEAARMHTIRSAVPDYTEESSAILERVRQVQRQIYAHEDPQALEKQGITLLTGTARFCDAKTLEVERAEGTIQLRAKRYLIATGSAPAIPSIAGLEAVPYHTNETLFQLAELPRTLLILGGGPIGVELAQALNRLGVQVELIQRNVRLLPHDDAELTALLQQRLVEEGLRLHLQTTPLRVEQQGDNTMLHCRKDGEEFTLQAEALFLATGRRAVTGGLGLENAGVLCDANAIRVDAAMRTSVRHIYAAGDVVGPHRFSHMANVQAAMAVQNALLPFARKVRHDQVVRVTFTAPELAHLGLTEAEARQQYGEAVRVYSEEFLHLDRAITEHTEGAERNIGRIKLIVDTKGRLLGASILAGRAGEMIAEAQLIKCLGISVARLGRIIHPYPTYGEVFWKLGKRVMVDRLLDHPLVRLFRKR